MKTSSQALWKRILKDATTPESWRAWRTALRELQKAKSLGEFQKRLVEVEARWAEMEQRKAPDPSLRSQLQAVRAANPFDPPLCTEAYFDACRKAPDASEGTKRKWRRAVGLL